MRASAIRDITFRAKTEGAAAAAADADKVGKAVDGAAKANDNLSRSTLSVDRALDRVRRQYDDAYRQSRQYESGLRTLDKALAMSRITADEYQRDIGLLATKYGVAASGSKVLGDALAASTKSIDLAARANDNFRRATEGTIQSSGLARHELINLGRQAQDVATMFAMGANPMQIFASQAAQIADVFASSSGTIGGFLRQVGGFIMSRAGMATGVATVAAGAAYSAYAYAESQKAVENALRGVGAASGATVAGINRVAEAEAAAAKVSVSSAREILSGYAATGRVDPTRLPGLVGFTKEYAAFQSIGVAEATKELAGAFADPTRGADMLTGKIGGLNSETRRMIVAQQNAGDMFGAQLTMLTTFGQQVAGATERTGIFARAFDALGRSASNASAAVGKAIVGPSAAEQVEALERQRQTLAAAQTGGALGAGHQLRLLEQQLGPLKAIVELERQRAAIDARAEERSRKSLEADEIVRGYAKEAEALKELARQRKVLDDAVRLNPGAGENSQWKAWSEALKAAEESSVSNAERLRQSNALTVRSIEARTLAERIAVAQAQTQLDLAGKVVTAKEREAQLQGRVNELMAQANREARDAAKSARDQLELAGLRPYQRRQREIDFELRDLRERTGGATTSPYSAPTGGVLPATTAAANGLDAAFAESLRRLMAAVPGLAVTSGFRTYEQQAKLYAEKGPGWAARPGTSNHEFGVAADLNYRGSGQLPAWIHERAREFGIHFPLANRARNPEPWHAEPINGRGRGVVAGDADASLQRIEADKRGTASMEAYKAIVGAANDNLAAQQRQLQATRDTMFMSTEEVAKAQKTQELYNQAVAEGGVDLANTLLPAIQRTAAGYGDLARQQQDVQQMQSTLRSFGDIAKGIGQDIYSGFRRGASGAEILTSALDRVASKLFDLALNDLIPTSMGGTGGGFLKSLVGLFSGGSYNFAGSGAYSYGAGGYTGMGPFLPSALGNIFGPGGLQRFALGGAFTNGIVTRPTLFPFANGIGLMGEAGDEAIMPLRRGRDGRLGVSAPAHAIPAPANSNGAVTFNLINNGQPVDIAETRETSDGRGGRRIDVVLKEKVGSALSEPGPARDALRNNYGARQRLAQR